CVAHRGGGTDTRWIGRDGGGARRWVHGRGSGHRRCRGIGVELPARDLLVPDPPRLDQLPGPPTPQSHLVWRMRVRGPSVDSVRTDRRRRHVQRAEVVAVIGGAVLLISSWIVVAVDRRVPQWEQRVFRDINDLAGWLWPVVRVPMQAGSLVGSLVIVGATWAISRNGRLAAAALLGSQAAYWSSKAVKSLADRARPEVLLHGVHVREHANGLGFLSG